MHEIGHSLGLNHSTDRSAVMYPHYKRYKPYLSLEPDDIEVRNESRIFYIPEEKLQVTLLFIDFGMLLGWVSFFGQTKIRLKNPTF